MEVDKENPLAPKRQSSVVPLSKAVRESVWRELSFADLRHVILEAPYAQPLLLIADGVYLHTPFQAIELLYAIVLRGIIPPEDLFIIVEKLDPYIALSKKEGLPADAAENLECLLFQIAVMGKFTGPQYVRLAQSSQAWRTSKFILTRAENLLTDEELVAIVIANPHTEIMDMVAGIRRDRIKK